MNIEQPSAAPSVWRANHDRQAFILHGITQESNSKQRKSKGTLFIAQKRSENVLKMFRNPP